MPLIAKWSIRPPDRAGTYFRAVNARINKTELLFMGMRINSFGLDERGSRGSTSGRNTRFRSFL